MTSTDSILENLIEENISAGVLIFENLAPEPAEKAEKSWPESDTFWEELDIINL